MTTFNDIKRRLEILCEQWSKPDDAPVPASAYVDCATELALLLADWPATVYREQADLLTPVERRNVEWTREQGPPPASSTKGVLLSIIDKLAPKPEETT